MINTLQKLADEDESSKRGRGRPRNKYDASTNSVKVNADGSKRGRGRPRKYESTPE